MQEMELAQIIFYVILVVVIGGSVIARYQGQLGEAFKHLLIWLCIGFVVFTVAVYVDGVDGFKTRMGSALFPKEPHTNAQGDVVLHKADNGHFYVNANVNGEDVVFMIDTGASSTVLSPDDARYIGVDVDRLAYTTVVSTANGKGNAAVYRVDEIRLGDIAFDNVKVLVNKTAMPQSLLGMSFLQKFSRFTVEGNSLVLTP